MTTIHLPNSFRRVEGPLCGIGLEPGHADRIITDWTAYATVNCHDCLQMAYLVEYNHLRSVPHPQPVKVRVYELVKQAGLSESKPVLRVLDDLGYEVKAPASRLDLEGFEHQALVAMLGDL